MEYLLKSFGFGVQGALRVVVILDKKIIKIY